MFIYLIVNHAAGKYYVGQHKGNNLKKYLQQKLSHARKGLSKRSRLYDALREFPAEAFTIHALLSDIQTKQELNQVERDFIAFLKSQDPEYGYNICRGGEGFTGPHSESARLKVGEASRKRWANTEYKKKVSKVMSLLHEGLHHTPETCQRIREIRTGSHHREDSKEKQRQNMLRREAIGGDMSARSKRNWADPKIKQAITDARREAVRNYSPEIRAKLRAAGLKTVESGQLARNQPMGLCKRWNINRGKPCVCGTHIPKP
jgi:hypothetical protein